MTASQPIPTSAASAVSASQPAASAPSSVAVSSATASSAPLPSSSGSASSAASSAAPATSTSSTPGNTGNKLVVAHHMIGNVYPYTQGDWAEDISLASASGIDGFALNMGTDDWQPERVADAYQAAQEAGNDFKLFLSLDMTVWPCNSPDSASKLRALVNKFADHPNQLKLNDRVFVSTFSGEKCNFGQGSVADGWKSQFYQHPELAGKIHFVPSFFVDPGQFSQFADIMDGDFNWNSAWPIEVTSQSASSLLSGAKVVSNLASSVSGNATVDGTSFTSLLGGLSNALGPLLGSTDTDEKHLQGLSSLSGGKRDGSKRTYMASASPWFFTHYGKDTFNKNFIYLADQHLYSNRWENLIASRDQFDIVQLLTWNDYGESHYMGPIKGDQPKSNAWVDGFNHTAWLDMTQYYATAFKTGAFPAIEKDKIIMWARPHAAKAQASDPVGPPTNFDLTEDAVWAVAMTSAPATVTLNGQTFDVPAGLTKLAVPIAAGDGMAGAIARDGANTVELAPEFTFEGSPKAYNFNAFVAGATAA
ncbi:glycoside hydrolase family 71 protein [Schizophyllum fasciatum]